MHGPPGLGKTTLAYIIAQEMGGGIKSTSGPVVERAGDLAALLTNLAPLDVLFIDEVHRLPTVVEEILYPAMEDFRLDLIIGQGPGSPLREAGAAQLHFGGGHHPGRPSHPGPAGPLRPDAAGGFLSGGGSGPDLRIGPPRCWGSRSMPTGPWRSPGAPGAPPASPTGCLKRVRDYAQVRADGRINRASADAALTLLDIDQLGFDRMDRQILLTILEKYDGGPVGLGTLAAALCEEEDTLEDVYEPYLIQSGFLQRTPRGRMATNRAAEYFAKLPKRGSHPSLFQGDKAA